MLSAYAATQSLRVACQKRRRLDITWLYHVSGSAFSVVGSSLCRSDGLELATGQSSRPGAQQQQLQTIAEDESISLLPLSTHSAVEMLYDSVLYKSIIEY